MAGLIDVMISADFNCGTVAELLTQDTNNQLGTTPLLEAAMLGLLSVMKDLLAAGGDASLRSSNQDVSLLDAAALMGHLELMRTLLLEHGVDVNAASFDGFTALLCAVRYGRANRLADVVDLLLSAGADINAPLDEGFTALHLACERPDSHDVTTILLQRGAAKDAVNNFGRCPLHIAAECGNLPATRALLAAGADTTLRAGEGYIQKTPLDFAARSGHVEVIREFVLHGVDLDAAHSESGCTALKHAARKNHADAVEALVEAGASVTADALDVATHSLALEAMVALLRHGATFTKAVVGCRYPSPMPPLHIATRLGGAGGAADAVELLLRWGADESERSYHGTIPTEMVGMDVPAHESLAADADRVRELLAKAPAESAWRRRGLLLLCLARDGRRRGRVENGGKGKRKRNGAEEKALVTDVGSGSGGGAVTLPADLGTTVAAAAAAAGRSKRERTQSEIGGGGGGGGSSSGCGESGGGRGSENGGDLGAVVALLLELEFKEEGLFRTIVKFL